MSEIIQDIEELQKVAKEGDAEAQYQLGICYELGRGVPKSELDAKRLYRLAANQGHAKAKYSFFLCTYDDEAERSSDNYKAFEAVLASAKLGYCPAQNSLALLYIEVGNYKEAIIWFKKAAEQGSPEAAYNLAYCYEVLENYPEAIKWCKKAVDEGYPYAQAKLEKLIYNKKYL